jgi:dihydroorotase
MQQNFVPDVISTDLHVWSMNGGMMDIINVMSKFLNMNMPIEKVIASVTWNPARYIKRPELGQISEGAIADIAILNLIEGDFGFVDTKGKKLKGKQKLVCEVTIKDGKVVYDLNGLSSDEWNK